MRSARVPRTTGSPTSNAAAAQQVNAVAVANLKRGPAFRQSTTFIAGGKNSDARPAAHSNCTAPTCAAAPAPRIEPHARRQKWSALEPPRSLGTMFCPVCAVRSNLTRSASRLVCSIITDGIRARRDGSPRHDLQTGSRSQRFPDRVACFDFVPRTSLCGGCCSFNEPVPIPRRTVKGRISRSGLYCCPHQSQRIPHAHSSGRARTSSLANSSMLCSGLAVGGAMVSFRGRWALAQLLFFSSFRSSLCELFVLR